ncbi:MAG: glucose 1-dehydrogenase [Acidimicrobiales bacterium]
MGELDARGALVTGGGSGIGAAVCRWLAAAGAAVAVVDRDAAAAETVARQVGGVAFSADVRDSAAVDRAVRATVEALGSLSIVVNNAGLGGLRPLEDYTDREWERLLAVNLTGAFSMIRAAAPHLRQAGKGAIVNVSSLSGSLPTRGEAPYSVAKAGLLALTSSAALELAPAIRVNSVSPGFIDTPLTAPLFAIDGVRAGLEGRTPLGRLGTADEVAATVGYLCTDAAAYVTGHNLVVDGGAHLIHAQADPMLRELLTLLRGPGTAPAAGSTPQPPPGSGRAGA